MQIKLTLIVLMFAMVYTVCGIVCPQDYCSIVKCKNDIDKIDCEQNKNGIFEENGSFCGCCPACITKLGKFLDIYIQIIPFEQFYNNWYEFTEKGQSCFDSLLRGLPPSSKCAPGLMCDIITKTCVGSLERIEK